MGKAKATHIHNMLFADRPTSEHMGPLGRSASAREGEHVHFVLKSDQDEENNGDRMEKQNDSDVSSMKVQVRNLRNVKTMLSDYMIDDNRRLGARKRQPEVWKALVDARETWREVDRKCRVDHPGLAGALGRA